MTAQPVPHRPARTPPVWPPARPVELATPPGPAPGGSGWVGALLPATSVLPVLALGSTGHAHGTALLLALLVIPAVGGAVAVQLAGRRRACREAAGARARWHAHLADTCREAAAAAAVQRLALDRVHPGDLTALVARGGAFERRPGDGDALAIAVGTGPVPALRPLARARASPLAETAADLEAAADAAVRAAAHLPAAPVRVDLGAVGVLAVVGPEAARRPVLTRIAAELATVHAPGELGLAATGLGGLTLLPHLRGGPGADAEADAVAGWLSAAETPLQVAVIGAYAPGACPALDSALATPGVVAVVGVAGPAAVPGRTGAVLSLAEPTLQTGGARVSLDSVDTLDHGSAAQLAALLARRVPDAGRAPPTLAALLAHPRTQELTTPIGLDPAGVPVTLRLGEVAVGGDGPHGLLVGATGSGKSVLLRTIVAGLAARHGPDELTLLLVDYKGGAAFADLAALPHVGGLVTNLADEPGLLPRVALALGAELERRQRRLRAAGVESRRAMPAGAGMPALLVAIDEAGELLAADPGLLAVLTRIGRVGRSLGVHLLMATQHWDSGRLHALDSHLRYRLCLRTFTADDSRAVLGTDAAMRLPARSGAAWLAVDGHARRVDVLAPPSDPTVLVGVRGPRAEPVWQPPLPAQLRWPVDGSVGLIDDPAARSQPPLHVDLDGAGGHVAVAGGPRSGVTSALRAVVHAAGPDVEVQVLDLAGGLADLAALPQVGTVAGLHQPALVRAVVAAVRAELSRRGAGAPGRRLLLVVDGVGLLRSDDGAVEAALADVAARGLAHGVHLLLGLRRWSELRGGLFDACGTRWELRLGDPAESLAGRAAAAALPRGVAGRGLLPDGRAFQLARPDPAAAPRGRPTASVALLPTRVTEPDRPGDGGFLLGVGGAAATPVVLDLLHPGTHLVVAGDSHSGRTTVLRRLVHHLSVAGPGRVAVHLLDPRRTLLDVAGLATSWAYAPEPAAAHVLAATAVLRARLPRADATPAELAARAPTPVPRQVVVIDDADLLDPGSLGGPLPAALSDLAALLPYAAEIGLHVVLARPASARGTDPLGARLRAVRPWTLALPGEHLDGPGAVRGRPVAPGRGLFGRGPAGGAPVTEVQCYLPAAPGSEGEDR